MENMPKDAGVKFDNQGNPRPYYGNTVVSFLNDPHSRIFQEAAAAQKAMKETCIAKKLAFLPPSSFHATILSLCREIDRTGEYWPKDIDRSLTFREVDKILKEKFDSLPKLEGVRMKVSQADELHLLLEAESPEDAKRIRHYRDFVAEAMGIRHWWHDTFVFHLTWAYKLQPFTEEQKQEIKPLLEQLTAHAKEQIGTLLLPPGEFVIFNNMMAYSNNLSVRGNLF